MAILRRHGVPKEVRMDVATLLSRARSARNEGVIYWWGKGGFDPMSPGPAGQDGRCDCSGFVCWALGLSRITSHPLYVAYNGGGGSIGWINSDAMVHDAGRQTGFFERLDEPEPGCIVMYPKRGSGRRYGHVGIVTRVAGGAVSKVVHCSAGNFLDTGDAIQETGPGAFELPTTIYAWYEGIER
jgi:hypothetical protein